MGAGVRRIDYFEVDKGACITVDKDTPTQEDVLQRLIKAVREHADMCALEDEALRRWRNTTVGTGARSVANARLDRVRDWLFSTESNLGSAARAYHEAYATRREYGGS